MIHFASTCSIKYTIARVDMTQEEVNNSWLQVDEFMRIQQRDEDLISEIEEKKIASSLKQRQHANNTHTRLNRTDEGVCIRGLESKMKLESLRKQSKRLIGLAEVFVEQEKQWDRQDDIDTFQNYYDDEAIAAVYRKVSKECKIRAEQVALKDREEVIEFMLHTNE